MDLGQQAQNSESLYILSHYLQTRKRRPASEYDIIILHEVSEAKGNEMKIKRILAIGNSFSEDATARLSALCRAGGKEAEIVNLYIGGCSLERHWTNLQTGEKAYRLDLNGVGQTEPVSLKDVLSSEKWDIVTLQQVSGQSGIKASFLPFLDQLDNYLRKNIPGVQRWIHETWAYETDSSHPDFEKYNKSQTEMYEAIKESYSWAAARIGARIIPCGDVIQSLRGKKPFDYSHGGMSLCRDGFHINLIYGRYALSCTWYECLLGDVRTNPYTPDAEADPDLLCLIRETVHSCVQKVRISV